MKVILSSPMILQPGLYEAKELSVEEAKEWVKKNAPKNHSCHETVKIIGVQPASHRIACHHYDEALCIKPKKRMGAMREYSQAEVEAIGVKILLIKRIYN